VRGLEEKVVDNKHSPLSSPPLPLFNKGRINNRSGKDIYKTESGNLYFHNQRNREHKFEELKKTVVETKEAAGETSSPHRFLKDDMDKAIKQHFDINRISDQVYQNIERRIRIERERRGL
jgi:hypothetical protein